jgi:hypothetical protein
VVFLNCLKNQRLTNIKKEHLLEGQNSVKTLEVINNLWKTKNAGSVVFMRFRESVPTQNRIYLQKRQNEAKNADILPAFLTLKISLF